MRVDPEFSISYFLYLISVIVNLADKYDTQTEILHVLAIDFEVALAQNESSSHSLRGPKLLAKAGFESHFLRLVVSWLILIANW